MNFNSLHHCLLGLLFEGLGNSEAAHGAFLAASKQDPGAFRPIIHLALIAAERKEFAEAADRFREALRIRPDDSNTWFNLGYVLGEDGQFGAAIEAFRAAVRCNPDQDRAWYGMGLACASCGEHAKAADAWQRATALQPMNGIAWYQLGMAHFHLGQAEEVEAIIRRLLAFDPAFCRQLIRDAHRSDLEHLVKSMAVPNPCR